MRDGDPFFYQVGVIRTEVLDGLIAIRRVKILLKISSGDCQGLSPGETGCFEQDLCPLARSSGSSPVPFWSVAYS